MLLRVLTFILGFSFLANPLFAQCVGTPNYAPQTLPDGVANYFLLSAEETFNAPGFDTFNPAVNPAIAGDRFDIDVIGRNTADQLAQRQLAVNYFLAQFGVDFQVSFDADPLDSDWVDIPSLGWVSSDGNWVMYHYTIEPRYNQRIVYSGGETVPVTGWVVHQGFYRMFALSPFAPIAGAWSSSESRVVQQGTFADFGEMRIIKQIPCETSGFVEEILDLNYESTRPTFPDVLSTFGSGYGYLGSRGNIDYNIYDEDSPLIGFARGRVELQNLGSDNYKAQVRINIKMN